MASQEIILKKYVNIGVAVDTDRGLLVPVIRDADTKNIEQLSVELSQLADKARTRKLTLDEMQGGCFTITNLGGIGGTAFTPIVNSPEVAILGISRATMQPVFKRHRSTTAGHDDGGFVPRLMLPLSLAYDHRVIDGADGIRFLRWVAEAPSAVPSRRRVKLTGHEDTKTRRKHLLPFFVPSRFGVESSPRHRLKSSSSVVDWRIRRLSSCGSWFDDCARRSRRESGRGVRVPRLHSVEGAAARRGRPQRVASREGVGHRVR
jgi:hypothetical protein